MELCPCGAGQARGALGLCHTCCNRRTAEARSGSKWSDDQRMKKVRDRRGRSGLLTVIESPTLDRIDNSKGYIVGNVWVISMRANRLKSDATVDELMMLATNLRELQEKM
jgi:hypothetical protein